MCRPPSRLSRLPHPQDRRDRAVHRLEWRELALVFLADLFLEQVHRVFHQVSHEYYVAVGRQFGLLGIKI